jgi:galactose oxidase
MIRYGSATHTVDTDQRRIALTPTGNSGGTYTFQCPNDSGVVLPGYYMLFALQNGVPSVAQSLQIVLA